MNGIWLMRYGVRLLSFKDATDVAHPKPTPVTEAQLFPLAPMSAARDAFKGILHDVEDAIERRLENAPDSSASHNEDIVKLNAIVQDLRTELGKPCASYMCLYQG